MSFEDFMLVDFIKETLEGGDNQVKKELEDYWNLMGVHSKLLDRVTNGKLSKTNYTLEAIEEVLDEIEEKDKELKDNLLEQADIFLENIQEDWEKNKIDENCYAYSSEYIKQFKILINKLMKENKE